MGDKAPHPTTVLIARLRRAAVAFDQLAAAGTNGTAEKWRAHANVCWQAAGRLEELGGRNVIQEFIHAQEA